MVQHTRSSWQPFQEVSEEEAEVYSQEGSCPKPQRAGLTCREHSIGVYSWGSSWQAQRRVCASTCAVCTFTRMQCASTVYFHMCPVGAVTHSVCSHVHAVYFHKHAVCASLSSVSFHMCPVCVSICAVCSHMCSVSMCSVCTYTHVHYVSTPVLRKASPKHHWKSW